MVAERRGVKVIHGANDGMFDVAGATVRSLQGSLADAFNLPDDAIAEANGRRVPNSYKIRGDDVLEFIRERGEKGGRKKVVAATPGGDGDDTDKDVSPDYSTMDLDALAFSIKARLSRSGEANRLSALQAHKSAVHLFWAGSALSRARDLCEQEGHGKWTAWKEEQGLAHSTANDAIRLFKGAKTPEALNGLGVTEAKMKFVYPIKEEPDGKSKGGKPKAPNPKSAAASGESPPERTQPTPTKGRKDAAEDAAPGANDDEPNVIDPTETLAERLEGIAQDLNEIAQDDMGKADWKGTAATRLENAIAAIDSAATKLNRRMNNDRSHS